jgi:hypothetical protein
MERNIFSLKTMIFFAMLLALGIRGFSQQQLAHIMLLNLTADQNGKSIAISSIYGVTAAKITESDFSSTTNNSIRLHKLLANNNFEFVFQVKQVIGNHGEFGLSEFENTLINYKFLIIDNNNCRIIGNNYTSPLFSYNNNSIFKISKCDGNLAFIIDGVIHKIFYLDPNIDQYEAYITPITFDDTEIFLSIESDIVDCTPFVQFKRFSVLNIDIPNSYSIYEDNILRFSFVQKYAVLGDFISLCFYTNDHVNILYQTQIPLIYGLNEIELNLPNGINFNDTLLEAKGINKNSTYYLKLKQQ